MLYAQPMDIWLIFQTSDTFRWSDRENSSPSLNGYGFGQAKGRIFGKSGVLSLMRISELGRDPVARLGNGEEESLKKNF